MPWKVSNAMDEKAKFVLEYSSGDFQMAELCRKYDITRQTGYKWVSRYGQDGLDGLKELSRAPHHNPRAINDELVKQILQVRSAHRTWGARKILAWLARHRPGLELCALSTVNQQLKHHGLVLDRVKRRRVTPCGNLTPNSDLVPNKVWCADFKGWFLCGNGRKCTPLTITDADTRFLLKLQSLHGSTDSRAVIAVFDSTFEEFGLPQYIRTDNGPPFASVGLGGLTELSVYWLELGIKLERIAPGCPQQNGRHERMHKTLKAETASPAMSNLNLQQKRFNSWRQEYNFERPHEALGQRPPGEFYSRSQRPMPNCCVPWSYNDEIDEQRRVRPSRQFKWLGRDVSASPALIGRTLGLKRLGPGYWAVMFRDVFMGVLDEKRFEIIRPGKSMDRILRNLSGGTVAPASELASLVPSPAPLSHLKPDP